MRMPGSTGNDVVPCHVRLDFGGFAASKQTKTFTVLLLYYSLLFHDLLSLTLCLVSGPILLFSIVRFNMAYDALGSREVNGPAMRRGLERSMSLQKIIVQQAVSIIERGQVACTPRLRYVFIHSDSSMNGTCTNGNGGLETALAHPLALVKLATFLINVHHEKGKWAGAKARPLVLLAQRPQTYLVVAVTVPDSHGSAARNRFGEHFRQVDLW